MNLEMALSLTKERIGIRSVIRDTYILAIVESVIKELEDVQGLLLDLSNPSHLMFVVDYSTWRYLNRDTYDGMPRNIQFRLHNLIIANKSDVIL